MHKRAVGIVIRDEKILLIRRFRKSSEWTKGWYFVFPGGGVEEGETPEGACIREIKEELSLDAKIEKLLFVMHNPAKVREFEGRDEYFYLISDFSGNPELGGPEKERMNENDQFYLDWVPIKEMKNMPTLYPDAARKKVISIFDEQTGVEQPELESKMNEIIAQEEGYENDEVSPEEQEKYFKGYSFSALVFSFFYFGYMKDKAFVWLSVVLGILFFPILFILPFFARKRAWKMRQWRSFNHFVAVQKKWDNWAAYGTIIFVLVFSLMSYYEVRTVNKFLNSSNINNMNDVNQLQKELQDTLGS